MMGLHQQRAFSMVELVMILVIIGILAVVALPRFADRSAYSARGYSDMFLAGLQYARKIAIASGCPVEFRYAAGNFQLWQPANCGIGGPSGGFTTTVPHPAQNIQFVGVVPDGVTPNILTSHSVVFTALGAALLDTIPDACTGVVFSGGGASFTIYLHGSTGYAGKESCL